MTYYRVDSTMWDDEDFLDADDLSRNVWQLLLTGPQRNALPGLQRATVASLADTLRRSVEAVSEAVGYWVGRNKLVVDPQRRVMRVVNAPRYNPAESPNQIRAWWSRWKEIPECASKHAHVTTLLQWANLEKESHRAAWGETFGTITKQKHSPLPPSDMPPEGIPEGIVKPSGIPPEGMANSVSVTVTVDGGEPARAPTRDRAHASTHAPALACTREGPAQVAPEQPNSTTRLRAVGPKLTRVTLDLPLAAAQREFARMVPIVDIDEEWLKFKGHHNEQEIDVHGKWAKWCGDAKRFQDRDRARQASAGANGTSAPVRPPFHKPVRFDD